MTLSWKTGGVLLGLVFFLAVALVKPIGVSTQFVILDGILWNAVDTSIVVEDVASKTGYASPNAYLDKSGGSYAQAVANPLNYGFVFVVAILIGAAASGWLRGSFREANRFMPEVWLANFGHTPALRFVAAFLGGFLVLYGARLAGGCTSGHMMSGIMQSAVSGYIFAAGAFLAAIPTAMLLYPREV
ncbi:MAG TPA: YeeE/YedE thiosulfate transporter family protein [Aurantimonas sp.]